MKKLTTLIITLIFAVSMVMAVPVQADGIPMPAGSEVALTSGQNTTVTFDVAESGTYQITANQTSTDNAAGYKVFVNKVPMGVVHFGTASSVDLGSYELLTGTNVVTLYAIDASIDFTNIVYTKTGALTGNCITVSEHIGSDRFTKNSTTWDGGVGKGKFITWNVDVPVNGNYEVYYVGANNTGGAQVELYYTNANVTADTLAGDGIAYLPEYDCYAGAGDMAYIGYAPLTEGENTIKIRVSQAPRSNPKGLMIKKVSVSSVSATLSGASSNWDAANNAFAANKTWRTVTATVSIPEAGNYDVYADVSSGWVDGEATTSTLSITYDAMASEAIGEGTYEVTSESDGGNGYGSYIEGVKLTSGSFNAGTINFYISKPDANNARIKNVILVKEGSNYISASTKLYVGNTIGVANEITTLRTDATTNKITVQTTLNKSQDAVVIAALYENGKIVDYDTMTQDSAVFTGELNTANVTNINACYIKVFVWDSLDDGSLTPLTKPHVR